MKNKIEIVLAAVVKYTENNGININELSLKVNSILENLIKGVAVLKSMTPVLVDIDDFGKFISLDNWQLFPEDYRTDVAVLMGLIHAGEKSPDVPEELDLAKILTLANIKEIEALTNDIISSIESALSDEMTDSSIEIHSASKIIKQAIENSDKDALEVFTECLSDIEDDKVGVIFVVDNLSEDSQGFTSGLFRGNVDTAIKIFATSIASSIDMFKEAHPDEDARGVLSYGISKALGIIYSSTKTEIDYKKVESVMKKVIKGITNADRDSNK